MKTALLTSISLLKNFSALAVLLFFSFLVKAQLPGCHAKFSYVANQPTLTVTFTDLSWYDVGPQNTTWSWDFGDGNYSTEPSPVHTYAAEQAYIICLTVTNCSSEPGACCSDTYCDTIQWGKNVPTFIEPSSSLEAVQLFPNPFTNMITLQLPASVHKAILTDLQGKILEVYQISTSTFVADGSLLEKGIYCLRFIGDEGILGNRLVVKE